jgi:hypothetical protein
MIKKEIPSVLPGIIKSFLKSLVYFSVIGPSVVFIAGVVFLLRNLPNIGKKINAIDKDADRAIITVIGRNFMNSPTIPGQTSRGIKTASVVIVEVVIGHAMRLAADKYAS